MKTEMMEHVSNGQLKINLEVMRDDLAIYLDERLKVFKRELMFILLRKQDVAAFEQRLVGIPQKEEFIVWLSHSNESIRCIRRGWSRHRQKWKDLSMELLRGTSQRQNSK